MSLSVRLARAIQHIHNIIDIDKYFRKLLVEKKFQETTRFSAAGMVQFC